jgi:AraC-like DNA-binding protein
MLITLRNENADKLLPIYVITVGMNFTQNPISREEGAPYHHILYIEEGDGILEAPDGRYALSQGMAVFMRKNIPMSYYGTGAVFKTAWITFDGKGVDDILDFFGARNVALLESKTVYSMIANSYSIAERNVSPEMMSKEAYDILITFFSELNATKRSPIFVRAMEFIEDNYMDSISVSDVASYLDVSESFLFKLFREGNENPPSEYLRGVRIRHAKQLLLSDPDQKISEVAKRCGFTDFAYFCKVFKAETGMTPRNYRIQFMQ